MLLPDLAYFISATSNRPSAFHSLVAPARVKRSVLFGELRKPAVANGVFERFCRFLMANDDRGQSAGRSLLRRICNVRCPTLATVAIATPSAKQAQGALSESQ
jgi:hypothetical protein